MIRKYVIVSQNYRSNVSCGVDRAVQELVAALKNDKVFIIYSNLFRNLPLKNYYQSIKAIQKSNLVFINGYYPKICIFFTIICILFKKKYIIINHGNITPDNIKLFKKYVFYKTMGKLFNRFSSRIIISSIYEAACFKEYKKINFLLFPIRLKINNNIKVKKEKIIIFLGRISKEKNIHYISKYFDENKSKNFKFKIYGSIIDKKYFDKFNLKQYYYGYIRHEKIYSILQKAWCLVLPSKTESIGLVVAESLLFSTPVIVTENSVWREALDKKCGIIIKPSFLNLKRALDTIMSYDENTIISMGNKGRQIIENEFSFKKFKKEFNQIIKDCLYK